MAGDPRLEDLEAQLKRKTDEIGILTRVAADLTGTLELSPLLDRILTSMDEVFGYSHSMVLLWNPDREVLEVAASRGYEVSGVGAEVPLGKGVIGVVGKRKKLMHMGGMGQQRSYMAAAAQQLGHVGTGTPLPGLGDVESVIAVPLLDRGELIGVFHVESSEPAVFDDRDLELVEAIAHQAAIAIQNARHYESEQQRLDQLESVNARLVEWNAASRRFIPHEFLAILGRERLPEVCRGDHAELTMSTFFSDVRGFTGLVEGQGPAENFSFINEYLTYMEAPIRAHDGFIDSYRGDGIVALFAGPADDAVRAAVDSLAALAELNEARERRGEVRIRIGIGVDTGHLMLGTIGGSERLSAGVIGDSANTASRIEALSKRYGTAVLISETTRNSCADPDIYLMRPIDRVRPQGKVNPITLYEVLDGVTGPELEGKVAGMGDYTEGLRLYHAGEPGDALVAFAAALKAYPSDRASQLFIGRCWQLIENGIPDGWDGVTALTNK